MNTVAYTLDTGVFVQAHRRYYTFDICPGFWEFLLFHHDRAGLRSIDRVRDEIEAGHDRLWDWVSTSVPESFFVSTDSAPVTEAYSRLMAWAYGEPQFTDGAKSQFAEKADAWLIAHAMATGTVLVTLETYEPNIRNRVKIPNACRQFEVPCVNTFAMLHDLKARFSWQAPA